MQTIVSLRAIVEQCGRVDRPAGDMLHTARQRLGAAYPARVPMALYVHNTLSKQRELFVPAQPKADIRTR